MSEEEYISKINKFIEDIEKVRDSHNLEFSLCKLGTTDFEFQMAKMHFDKYKAYDFVIRKLRRTFNLVKP